MISVKWVTTRLTILNVIAALIEVVIRSRSSGVLRTRRRAADSVLLRSLLVLVPWRLRAPVARNFVHIEPYVVRVSEIPVDPTHRRSLVGSRNSYTKESLNFVVTCVN
jgi:hypothetical protein